MSEKFNQGYAVVIGIGADLPVTVDDATAIAHFLNNPACCAYPHNQVRLLTEDAANRESILSSLDWLANTAEPNATAIVYFSGHGLETPDYYLMPFGYDIKNLESTAISGQLFSEKLRSIQTRQLLVLLDCCHAGGQAQIKGAVKSPLPPTTIDELKKHSGRVIIASSRKDEVSWTGNPYSVFTTSVLEALAGYGAFEQDGFARVLDLALWAGRKVPERTNEKQHPIIKVSNLEDNFAIAWYAGGAKKVQPLEWISSHSLETSSVNAAQLATWQRMLVNYRENLLLIEERMSEYVDFTAIPLQLIKSKRQLEAKITDLEQKLGLTSFP
ncbi:caspase family protein [Nostoc sp. UIC 10630]|uniref:caspase family protein n=1 Tax=Nostoc sp. UIC 10630 TaxID=2100146 RepID=UPI0013D5BADE|nr:caspase family protein [Nostoc sp. UIC 10630]NEU81350.1 caspase family protein [Nostoc sp. UIC 10630]